MWRLEFEAVAAQDIFDLLWQLNASLLGDTFKHKHLFMWAQVDSKSGDTQMPQRLAMIISNGHDL